MDYRQNQIEMTPVNQGAMNYTGTRPISGILQLDVLLQEGLKPHHSLFELGCGALVGSIPIIRYLDKDKYYGVDPNEWLRIASLSIDGNRDILLKNPTFYSNEDFRPENEIKFDFIFSHSILNHAANWQLELFLDNVKKHMKKDTIIIVSLHFAEGGEYCHGYGPPNYPQAKLNSDEWTYPGINFKPKDYVFECCKKRNLKCEHIEKYTKFYTQVRPGEFHDWIRITKEE